MKQLVVVAFEVVSVHPASGPTSGGSVVRLRGQGFLGLAAYKVGLICTFGGVVGDLAQPLTDELLECLTPKVAGPRTVVLGLAAPRPHLYHLSLDGSAFAARARSFSFYENPVVLDVHPTKVTSEAPVSLTVALLRPLTDVSQLEIVCRLTSMGARGGATLSTAAIAETSSLLACPFPPLSWAGHEAQLAVSLNGGADFSAPFSGIRVEE
jgi:hypothetical protein